MTGQDDRRPGGGIRGLSWALLILCVLTIIILIVMTIGIGATGDIKFAWLDWFVPLFLPFLLLSTCEIAFRKPKELKTSRHAKFWIFVAWVVCLIYCLAGLYHLLYWYQFDDTSLTVSLTRFKDVAHFVAIIAYVIYLILVGQLSEKRALTTSGGSGKGGFSMGFIEIFVLVSAALGMINSAMSIYDRVG